MLYTLNVRLYILTVLIHSSLMDNVNEIMKCAANEITYTTDPINCQCYYVSCGGKNIQLIPRRKFQCTESFYWDQNVLTCVPYSDHCEKNNFNNKNTLEYSKDKAKEAKASAKMKPKMIDPSICDDGRTYHPDPNSCRHFIQCSNGIPYRFPCAEPLFWNQKILSCVWDSTHCAVSGSTRTGPITASTSIPTTQSIDNTSRLVLEQKFAASSKTIPGTTEGIKKLTTKEKDFSASPIDSTVSTLSPMPAMLTAGTIPSDGTTLTFQATGPDTFSVPITETETMTSTVNPNEFDQTSVTFATTLSNNYDTTDITTDETIATSLISTTEVDRTVTVPDTTLPYDLISLQPTTMKATATAITTKRDISTTTVMSSDQIITSSSEITDGATMTDMTTKFIAFTTDEPVPTKSYTTSDSSLLTESRQEIEKTTFETIATKTSEVYTIDFNSTVRSLITYKDSENDTTLSPILMTTLSMDETANQTETNKNVCNYGQMFYADPYDERYFIYCMNNVPQRYRCDEPFIWNQEALSCVWIERKCFTRVVPVGNPVDNFVTPITKIAPIELPIQCNADDTYIADPNNCHVFYHCSNGVPFMKICPGNLYWDPKLLTCSWSNGNCFTNNKLPDPRMPIVNSYTDMMKTSLETAFKRLPFIKSNQNKMKISYNKKIKCYPGATYLPDPNNCNVFYHCSNGTPFKKLCPSNLFWDPILLTCTWNNDNCL